MVLVLSFSGFFILCLALGVFYFRRHKWRGTAAQNKRELVVSRMAGLTMGAMLLGLQAVVSPESRPAIVERQREDETENELPGGSVLRRQLRQIRKGEDIDALTVRLDE